MTDIVYMLNNLRLQHGLFWRKRRPSLADYPRVPTHAVRLLIVLALWGWAMDQDCIAEHAADTVRAERAEQTLLDCLNGKARWVSADGTSMTACDVWSTDL